MSDPIEEVQKLVRLAAHARGDENERRNAGVRACESILEHDLILVPRAEHERLHRHRERLIATVTKLYEELKGAAARAPSPLLADPIVPRRRRRRKVTEILSSAAGEATASFLEDVLNGRR